MHPGPNFRQSLHVCYQPILFGYLIKQHSTPYRLILAICLPVIIMNNKSWKHWRTGRYNTYRIVKDSTGQLS